MIDRERADPVIKIRPEMALLHLPLDFLVGGCHKLHVHADLLDSPEPDKSSRLKDSQQLSLESGRHFSNLVEEKRSVVGNFQEPQFS